MELTVCVCQSWLAILNRVRVLVLFNRKVSTMQLLCWYSKHQISKSYFANFGIWKFAKPFSAFYIRNQIDVLNEVDQIWKLLAWNNNPIVTVDHFYIFVQRNYIGFFSPCNLIVRLAIKCSLCWLVWKFSVLSINCTHQKTRFRLFVL